MGTHLPVVLENLRIATPCSANWDDMSGDAQVRFCGQCHKNVYNLSAMRRDEAEALIAAREGRVCVRFYQRADGTVLTADCPVGLAREKLHARVFNWARRAAAAAALVVGLHSLRARGDASVGEHPTPPKPPVHVLMGGPVPNPHPTPPPRPPTTTAKRHPTRPATPVQPEPVMGKPMMGDVAYNDPK